MVRVPSSLAKRLAALEASSNPAFELHGDKQAACRAYAAMLVELGAFGGSASAGGGESEDLGRALANPIAAAEAYSELIRIG